MARGKSLEIVKHKTNEFDEDSIVRHPRSHSLAIRSNKPLL